MHAIVLTPAADYPDPWDWAFDVEARALEAAGFSVEARPWTDPGDIAGADAVLPLVAWGYDQRIAEWHALLDRAEAERWPMINPPALLRWNSDKAYLEELAAAGVPTVPTRTVDALDEAALADAFAHFGSDILVVKPPVSAAAVGTYRIARGAAVPPAVAGRRMLIQPFMASVTSIGEYSLMMFGGTFGHAIVKRPAKDDFRVQPHLGGRDYRVDPPHGAVDIARAALAAAPARAVYARVDLIGDRAGQLRVIEIELIEPALFLHQSDESARLFGAAIASAAATLRA